MMDIGRSTGDGAGFSDGSGAKDDGFLTGQGFSYVDGGGVGYGAGDGTGFPDGSGESGRRDGAGNSAGGSYKDSLDIERRGARLGL